MLCGLPLMLDVLCSCDLLKMCSFVCDWIVWCCICGFDGLCVNVCLFKSETVVRLRFIVSCCMVCVVLVVFVCGSPKRVCVFVYGLLCDGLWYFFVIFLCIVLCLCGLCDRMCDGVWRVLVVCLCTCGLKINNCVCVFCVGLKL